MHLDPAIIYHDLKTDLVTFRTILADRTLAVDEFASTHRETIRRHYAKVGGCPLDQETAHQAAVALLGYLRPSPIQNVRTHLNR
ncbi:hypothetical protein [Thiocystis violascens]|uniref:Uncharacterized protein n=1 Tax=Thiocystis violascens (strain ATCC 17096 / DSM 198 / 6111) TaxID=765911 RepID=I3YDL5_THIV6|nr:hypothetical protein [Thiocystis violascens]AFL75083.1 hypothetical protein Thivi_3206 [Thiocystis violascens DSM 198]